jgi:murein DD-endopeptidase MepM/ murein hydrolase activator NlpD
VNGIHRLFHARPRPSGLGRRLLALFGWLAVFTLSCPALPPVPRSSGRQRVKEAALQGESHVPGFPTTPVRLTREYVNAFMRAEADAPDEARILHAFKHPDMGLAVITFLPRYFSPRLVEPTRKLVRSTDPAIQAGALGGLISLLDNTPETRTFVRGLWRAPNPAVRGRAAEYFCWLGTAEDYAALIKFGGAERDAHARAAMVEALQAIKRRATRFGAGPAAPLPTAATPAETYQQLADLLAAPATDATRQAALARLRTTEVFEPITRYSDRLEHADRGAAWLRTQRLLVGYPATADAATAAEPPTALPVASTLMAPVRNYFDATRKSYGLLIQPEAGNPFSGKYHVGDDCAWQQDHETVVAIGHGIVRSVDLGRKSWGGLVIVEHADAGGGRFCSLYGHLGPLVCVQPGQVVRQGQKLGAVGPSYSHANGGYLAHLHFGIHRGAFLLPDRVGAIIQRGDGPGETATVTAVREETAEIRLADGSSRTIDRRANWTGGYLTPAEFTAKSHGWVEPQEFIRKFK